MERVGGGVYINGAWRGMKKLLAITLSLILAGCATSQMSKKMLDLSTAPVEVIVEQIKRGEFDWHIAIDRSFADQKSVVCDWVASGKRPAIDALLNRAGSRRLDFLNTAPLLPCVSSEADYVYYKRLGAKVQEYEWTGQYYFVNQNRATPLSIAVGNGNLLAASLLLKDGADVNRVGRMGMTPIGYALALRNGYLASKNQQHRSGRWPGIWVDHYVYEIHPAILQSGRLPKFFAEQLETARYQPDTIQNLNRLIDVLLHSDGSYTSLTLDTKNIETVPHSRTKLEDDYKQDAQFMQSKDLSGELQSHLYACNQGVADNCRFVVGKADPLSSFFREAGESLVKLEAEEREWISLSAAQRCRVQGKNWLYEGSACANGMAQGAGRARSRDRQIVVDGQFERGLLLSGRLIVGGSPSYEGGFSNWEPEGMGICWHQGRPEECRMQAGARIDSLHKQRVENERLRRERARQEKEEAQARREREWEAERRHRAQQEEDRRERRNERALAAGIAAMRGGNSGQTAPNSSLDSTLRMVQQQNQLIAQGNAELLRMQAQREEARRDEIRRDAAQQEAERRARDQVQKRQAVQHASNEEATRVQQQKDADDKRARDEAARRIREEEARRQQEIQAAAARREAERLQRERDRQTEQRELDRLKSDYLRAVKDGVRMKAVSCAGSHYVTGTRPRVKEPAHMSSCVDVAVTAWCPGDRTGRALVATNFVGMSGCLGDTYKIEPKPACEAEQMRVVVEDVRPCR